MSYLRKKVSEMKCSHGAGRYESPLTVFFTCETPEHEIIYTLDGTYPMSTMTTPDDTQASVYNDISGITLKGGGSHIISVVARRPGLVPTPCKRFKYVLSGPRPPKKAQALRDAIIERRFNTMTALDPPMPLRLARARTPQLKCALVDTCGKEELTRMRNEGQELALFELTHNSRVVSRQDTYRRIVAPSLSLALPQLPSKQPLANLPPPSLRSTQSDKFANSHYEQPTFHPTHLRRSRSVTTKTLLGVKEHFSYKPPKTALGTAKSEISWFENKTGLLPDPEREYDDPVEKEDARLYNEGAAATMHGDAERMSFSPAFGKSAKGAISISSDIAVGSKGIVTLIHTAKEFCKSQLSRLLGIVSYSSIAAQLQRAPQFVAGDLAGLSEGSFSVAEASKGLKCLGPGSNKQYETKQFLLFCRYAVWVARSNAEAVFGIAIQHWKALTLANGGTEARATRMDVQLLIDAYRRTRGCHEECLEDLYQRVYKLPWGVDDEVDTVPYGIVHHMITAHFPMLDANLVDMNNFAHPMYHRPLDIWGELHHN